MANKIGALIALDGEKQFRDSVKNCNTSIKQMKSEMKMLNAQYSGQEKSVESLSAKQKTLSGLLDAQKKKEDEITKSLKSAKDQRDKISSGLEKLNKEYEKEANKLEDIAKLYGTSSKEYKDQEKVVTEYASAIEKGNKNLQTAEGRVAKWTNQLTEAKTETYQTENQLNKLNNELSELERNADGSADELEDLAKASKDAKGGLGEASEGASSFKNIFAGNLVSDIAMDGLSKLKDIAVESAEYMVEVGSAFESEMAKVQALSGASSGELERMSNKAKELGSSTQFSASEVAESFSFMALAGWDANQSIEGIDGILSLAAASGMDLASASDMVTDNLSAFGLEAKDSAKMADQLAYAQANSNTTTEQLGEAFKNSAANMKANGQSMETTVALLEAMANQGIKGSEAGTKLTAVMRDLNKHAKDGKVQIGDTAIAIADEAGNYRQLTDIMKDVADATSGMTEIERTQALQAVFTQHSISATNMILNEGVDAVEGYALALENCEGSAEAMANTMNDTLQGDMTELSSAFEGLGIVAYDYFNDTMRGAVQLLTGAIQGITTSLTPQKDLLESFIEDIQSSNNEVERIIERANNTMIASDEEVSKLERYHDLIIELNSKQGELTEFEKYQMKDAVNELAGSIPELSDAFDENTGKIRLNLFEINKLFTAQEKQAKHAALMSAMNDVYEAQAKNAINLKMAEEAEARASEEQNKAIENKARSTTLASMGLDVYTGAIGDASDKMLDATLVEKDATSQAEELRQKQEDLENIAKELAEEWGVEEDAVRNATDANDTMVDSSGQVIESLSAEAQSLIESYTAIEEAMRSSLEGQIGLLNDMTGAYANDSGEIVDSNGEIVESLADVAKEMQDSLDTQIEAVERWSENLDELAQKGVDEGLLEKLAELGPEGAKYAQALNTMSEDDLNAYQEKWKTLLSDVDMEGQVGTSLEGIATALDSNKGGLTDAMNAIGVDSVKGFVQGMNDSIDLAKTSSEETGNAVLESIKTVLGVHSPSTEFAEVGKNSIEGYVEGVDETKDTAIEATEAVGSEALEAFTNLDLPTALSEIGTEAISGLTDAIDTEGDYAIESAEYVAEGIYDSIDYGLPESDFYDIGANVAYGLGDGIYDAADYAIEAAQYMAEAVYEASRTELDIHSPSKKFAQLGMYSAMGYGEGFTSEIKSVMGDVSNSMNPTLGDIPKSGGTTTVQNGNLFAEIPIYMDGEIVRKETTRVVIKNLSDQQLAKLRAY